MAALTGWLIGSLIGCYLLYSLLHWALFKRIFADRLVSHMSAALTSYPVGATIYGLGAGQGDAFSFDGFVSYFVPSLVILGLAFKRGRDARRVETDDESVVFQ